MTGNRKLAIASALILAIVAAPALACLVYIAQNAYTHNCCPQEKPQTAILVRCCVYSPAATARGVDIPAPMIAAAMFRPVDPVTLTPSHVAVVVPNLDTSPPGCSSILRI